MTLILIGVAVVTVIAFIVMLAVCYKTPSNNEALFISGLGLKQSVPVIGRGRFVIPIFQSTKKMSLNSFNLEFKVTANTNTQVPLTVSGNASLNIGSEKTLLLSASQRLLGLSNEQRNSLLLRVIEGHVRGILGNMSPDDVPNNRLQFQTQAIELSAKELMQFGIELQSLQIINVTDDEGYIDALSAKAIAVTKSQAESDTAEAQRKARENVADQERLAKSAEFKSQREIADSQRETEITIAGYKVEQDTAKAKADNAYSIANAEASKRVIATEGEANQIKAEQDQLVSEKKVIVAENELRATVIANADAEKQAGILNAEADKEIISLGAEAESDKIRMTGNAEAEKIKAIGEAQAKAQSALAEALTGEGGQQVLRQAIIDVLPEMARAYAEAIKGIDNMTVFNGADGVTGTVDAGLSQVMKLVKDSTGIDIAENINKRASGEVTLKGNSLVDIHTSDTGEAHVTETNTTNDNK